MLHFPEFLVYPAGQYFLAFLVTRLHLLGQDCLVNPAFLVSLVGRLLPLGLTNLEFLDFLAALSPLSGQDFLVYPEYPEFLVGPLGQDYLECLESLAGRLHPLGRVRYFDFPVCLENPAGRLGQANPAYPEYLVARLPL